MNVNLAKNFIQALTGSGHKYLLPALLASGSFGCGVLVEYSDKLVDSNQGRSAFVTKPSTVGGFLGFAAGIPVDLAALPISYVVYSAQKTDDEEGVDPASTFLFPSFFLQRTLILAFGTPLDLLEFGFYRVWTRPALEQDSVDLETIESFEKRGDPVRIKR